VVFRLLPTKGANGQMKSVPTIVKVTAAIIVRDGKILIAQRHPTDRMAGLWEFPGGKVEAGETPEACLRRELKEELAIDVRIGEALGISVYHYDHISIRLMAYQAFWKRGSIKLSTHRDYRWVNPDQLDLYAFTPADLPFVNKLSRGELELK